MQRRIPRSSHPDREDKKTNHSGKGVDRSGKDLVRAPGVVVGLDVVGHAVEGAGQVGHFPFAFHAFHTHGQVAAAKALGRVGHLLQRVGEFAHQQLGQDAGAQQHHAGRQQEVGPELLLELGELPAGGAQKDPAALAAALVAHI